MNCWSCQSRDFAVERVARGFAVRACRACGVRSVDAPADPDHVTAHFGDGYFTGGGAGYANYLAGADLVVAALPGRRPLLARRRPAVTAGGRQVCG